MINNHNAMYTTGVSFFNSSVWDTDFTEAADSFNFDRSTNLDAIAYFSGHGICDDQQPATSCIASWGCASPPPGASQGVCLRSQAAWPQGKCAYNVGRNLVAYKNSICQNVNYSSNVRWGESPVYGAWGGAGTDGGVNFAVLDVSCGVTPNMWVSQLNNMNVGLSTVATIMPTSVGSDTADSSNRGSSFANRFKTNKNSPIAWAWRDSINSTTGGSSCFLGGGSKGIHGCGANLTFSSDITAFWSSWKADTETWVDVQLDVNDAEASGFKSTRWTCNYDCNANPWAL